MSKEVVKKVEAAPALAQAMAMDQWDTPVLSANDIVIEKILPLQKMSKKLEDRKAGYRYSELRSTMESRLFGDLDQGFEFIPVAMERFWVITEGKDKKFVGIVPENSENQNLPYEEMVDGKLITRVRFMEFYVLIPSDVKDGGAVPYLLSFKSTSLKAGKSLATQMYVKNRAANLPPPATVCELTLEEKSNDKGTFLVQSVKAKRKASAEEIQAAFNWYTSIKSGAVKKDDSDLVDTTIEDIIDVDTKEF